MKHSPISTSQTLSNAILYSSPSKFN